MISVFFKFLIYLLLRLSILQITSGYFYLLLNRYQQLRINTHMHTVC